MRYKPNQAFFSFSLVSLLHAHDLPFNENPGIDTILSTNVSYIQQLALGEEKSLTLISLSIDTACGNVYSKFVSRPFTVNTLKVGEKEPNGVHHIVCRIDTNTVH